ncbi:MAG: hypothetical protein L3J52_03510 [Proteobacteria bacterium]|nr:hypothetical protein [Pseudomonadota bacterium]
MKKMLVLVFIFMVSACTSLKIVETNPDTGYFPGSKRATVIKSIAIDLDSVKDLVLVPNGEFTNKMVENIEYFDEVITFEDLEKIIIRNDLTDKVPSVNDRIGINKAAKAYKKFLWIRWDSRKDGSKLYQQLLLTDPISLEDIFICETHLDYVWTGVNDQANFYPMMNSLIDYIRKNSITYRK